jgi:flagellar biosynthetic protein FlhB
MAAARMDKQIASADVIVAGKDVAVAVAFDPATMVAPRVVVRGKSAAAKSIRETADEKGVATVERDALAGALFRAVAVGHDVPERFFAAVADVIAYAKQLKPRGGL